jgi:hypothetical protein
MGTGAPEGLGEEELKIEEKGNKWIEATVGVERHTYLEKEEPEEKEEVEEEPRRLHPVRLQIPLRRH